MSAKHALRRRDGRTVFEAFRELVYLKDDVPQLAAFMGLKVGTLYNKADASDETHNQPTVRDLMQVTHYRGDLRAIHALNEMFDQACFDAARYERTSDVDLLALLARLGAESGEFHQALGQGLAAQRFTAAAAAHIRGEAFDMVSALMTLVRRIEDYVDEGGSDASPTR